MRVVEPDAELNVDVLRFREAQRRVGTTLRAKWRLDALLGVGGIAAVYAATHRNGLRGAVKVLHAEHARDQTTVRRFVREGYVANKVEHALVVRVLDDDVDDDKVPFLVMELLDGEALDERARASGGRMLPSEVMWLTYQLLDVLAAAHDKGIVHRDLKPENLFLLREGALKVLDFGLAGFFEGREVGQITGLHGHTTVVMGTPAFMSPEQARGRFHLVDAQSDLWAVGATMFTLLTGEVVHPAASPEGIIVATFSRTARSLAEVMPDAPPALVSIVDRALQREKARRWLDARSMQEALAAAYLAVVGTPMPSIPAPAPRDSFVSQRPSDALFSLTESPSARPRSPSDAPTLLASVPGDVERRASPVKARAAARRGARAHAIKMLTLGAAFGVAGGFAIMAMREPPTLAPSGSAAGGEGGTAATPPIRSVSAAAMRLADGMEAAARRASSGGEVASPSASAASPAAPSASAARE